MLLWKSLTALDLFYETSEKSNRSQQLYYCFVDFHLRIFAFSSVSKLLMGRL